MHLKVGVGISKVFEPDAHVQFTHSHGLKHLLLPTASFPKASAVGFMAPTTAAFIPQENEVTIMSVFALASAASDTHKKGVCEPCLQNMERRARLVAQESLLKAAGKCAYGLCKRMLF